MHNLNKDLYYEIFKFLPVCDYASICLASKFLNEYLKQNKIRKYKCHQECYSFYLNYKMSFYECYKLFHILTKIKIKLNLKQSLDEIFNLKVLQLSDKQIKEIQKELGILKNLTVFNLFIVII